MRRRAQGASLQNDLSRLLVELCEEWGFCIPPDDRARIAASPGMDAAEFAAEVLRAEGFDPEHENHWRRKIERCFIERFGGSVSVKDYLDGER